MGVGLAYGSEAGAAVSRVAVDTAGFRFEKVASIDDPDFWPGAVKYGDLHPGTNGP